MSKVQTTLIFLGRIFFSIFFVLSAVNKILEWPNAQRALVNAIGDWNSYVTNINFLREFFSGMMAWVPTILASVTACELIGGLLLFLGLKVRFGAFLLVLFFIPLTLLLHQFWFLTGAAREVQTMLFFKNIAIIGGLLYVLAFGKGQKGSSAPQVKK